MYRSNIHAAHEGLLEKRMVFGTLSFGYAGEPISEEKTIRGRTRKRIVIDENAAAIVRSIFRWYGDERLSINEIIRRLNADPEAPLPPRCARVEWTRLSVKRVLENTRYRGLWQYGATEAVFVPDADYVRQRPRSEPLKTMQIEELRIVSDALWYAAQERPAGERGERGRRVKSGDRRARPKLLNGLFFCPEHDRPLYVAGAYGQMMHCPSCQRVSAESRTIFTLLNRKLALQLTCKRVTELLRADPELIEQVIAACQREAESCQRPDPSRLSQLEAQVEKLTRSVDFALREPGETEEDQRQTKRTLDRLRGERAQIQSEIHRIRVAQQQPIEIPSRDEVLELLKELEDVLLAAALQEGEDAAEARAILEAITGGRIELYQQGERKAQNGWLQGRFQVRLLDALVERLTGVAASSAGIGLEVVIDYQHPVPFDEDAERAWQLYQQNRMNAEIAQELKCSRSNVTKRLKYAAAKHGEILQDGRSRRSSLEKKHLEAPLYQQIADRAVELWNEGQLQIDEIAAQLTVDRNTITHAVAYWRRSRGLPVPDGLARRKRLASKAARRPQEDQPPDSAG